MTELEPSLVLKAFATPQLDVGNLLETRQQLKLRNLAQAKAERQESDALAAQQRRQSIGAQAATDPTGARQAAAGAGDFELVQALDKMDEATRKRVTDISRATAPLLMSLKTVSPEQRPAALQGMASALMERGFSESQVQDLLNGDLSDGKLDTLGNQAMTIEEYNKANEAYTLSPGSKRFQGGKVIAEVPFAPRTISVSPGEEVIEYLPGGGTSPGAGGSIPFDALIGIESGGQHFGANGQPTTSPKGAIGIAQVMPGTAPEAARLAGVAFDENRYRNDPAYNRQLGEAYYNAQRAKYGDDIKAAAAYNAGPGAVDKAIARGGDNWLQHLPAETRAYVAKLGGGQGGSPRVLARGAPKPEKPDPAIAGNRKAEADLRKEFNARPEVKDFKARRGSWLTIDKLAKQKPSAQNDMALIFSFMKMLDPGSVVREGEFANAQNAAGVDDRIRNAYNKALSGEIMNPDQRKGMVNSAASVYTSARDVYNPIAQEFQGYARDYGLNPDRIAQEYRPTRAPRQASGGQSSGGGWGKAQVVQ